MSNRTVKVVPSRSSVKFEGCSMWDETTASCCCGKLGTSLRPPTTDDDCVDIISRTGKFPAAPNYPQQAPVTKTSRVSLIHQNVGVVRSNCIGRWHQPIYLFLKHSKTKHLYEFSLPYTMTCSDGWPLWGKLSAVCQPTWPTQPSILLGSINE